MCRATGLFHRDDLVPHFGVIASQEGAAVDHHVNLVGASGNRAGGQPVTLTVQPGVRVFGTSGQTALQVNRGSRIVAEGTPTLPIIFTSREDILGQATATSRGQWGGLVILGRAPINACVGQPGGTASCETSVEGVPVGFFGGDQVNDNSGILKYVQVKHSGFTVSANVELNGITLGAVGAGTTIDYVQVHNSSDDGIEWFDRRVVLQARAEADYENAAAIGLNIWPTPGGWRAIYAGIGTRFGYYSICEATSTDGLNWERGEPGENLAMAPQGDGWESKMVEYPNIIEENGRLRLFYCGNGYGTTGIGTALAEKLDG